MKLDIRSVDLSSVVETAVETIIPVAQSKELVVQLASSRHARNRPGGCRSVPASRVERPIKFTPSKGSIRVGMGYYSAARAGYDSRYRYRNGAEPPREYFYPVRTGRRTRTQAGLGLGLPIVKHLVELHRGRIEVHSKGGGKATTVLVEGSPCEVFRTPGRL
jgi:two-component system CheB/CheR fusion protein